MIAKSIVVKSSPERVWEYVSHPEKYPDYLPFSDVAFLSKQRDGTGTKFSHKFKAGMFSMSAACQLTDAVPNEKQGFEALEGLKLKGNFALAPVEEGTQVTLSADYEPPWSIAGKVINALMMRRQMDAAFGKSLVKLKDILDTAQ